jgi:hypothetical protein
MVVPAAVPSLTQSSWPCTPSCAVNRSRPCQLRRSYGSEDAEPGRMSFTSTVPAEVPSLFHSSVPSASWAVKNRVGPTMVRLLTWSRSPGLGSPITMVPADVPSVRQRSPVAVPTCAAK